MNRTAFYYDNLSNLTCVLDPDNGLTYYTYDSLNRVASVKNPWGEVTQYEYSPGGRMLKRLLGNGTMAYYSYDAVGQVRKVENVKADLTVISSFEYERNAVGSPMSILREDGSVVYYEYDPKQQLTKETHVDPLGLQVYGWTWDYDLAGNRTRQEFNGVETTYEYNAANELTKETADGDTTYYEYDHNGNTTAQVAPGGTTQYHWDRENLMTQVDLPDDGHSYFAYDADGKRVGKQDSDGYTRFIYQGPDMLKLLQERNESDDLQAQYTVGNGLEAMRRGSTSNFYHFDWLGSTFELTNAAQTVTDTYLYNAWGEVLGQTGTTGNPHTYAGKDRYHRVLGQPLYLLSLRQYLASVARYLVVDRLAGTARDADSAEGYLNWYQYVDNLPTRETDPLGLFGPDMHRDMTVSVAMGVVVTARNGQRRCFRPEHATVIGQGDLYADRPATLGSSWHFDNDVMRAPFGTRADRLLETFDLALRYARARDCRRAFHHLGQALHPAQDTFGHGDLTPCEHIDRRIGNNPDNAKLGYWKYTGITPRWRGVVFWLLCHEKRTRLADFPISDTRRKDTELITRLILEAYLREAQCCFDVA